MQLLTWNIGHFIAVGIALWLVLALDRRASSRAFWLGVAAIAAVLAFVGFEMSDPGGKFEDFRRAYWEAGAAIWNGTENFGDVYARGTDGFVNIPAVVFLFAPFGLLDKDTAAAVFTFLGILAAIGAWRVLSLHSNLSRRDAALLAIAFAVFGPLLYSLREGNLSHFLLLGLSGALMCFASGRHVAAGLLLGLLAVLKPSLGLIGVYFLLRGQWRVVAGGAAVCMGTGLLSLAVFGWDVNLHWYEQAVAPFAAGPVPGFNAQSIPAFIARFETGALGLRDWDAHTLSDAGRLWVLVLSGGVVAACLAAFLRNGWRPPSAKIIELELLIIVALSCAVSSLSWSHYYVWLLPAFVMAWKYAETDVVMRGAVIVAFALCAPLEFLSWPMASGKLWLATNFLTSHLLAGGMLLLAVLLKIRWQAPRELPA